MPSDELSPTATIIRSPLPSFVPRHNPSRHAPPACCQMRLLEPRAGPRSSGQFPAIPTPPSATIFDRPALSFSTAVNNFLYRITNATSEGFNSVIQALKYAARGFRSFGNYRTRILFYCGRLDLRPRLTCH